MRRKFKMFIKSNKGLEPHFLSEFEFKKLVKSHKSVRAHKKSK